MENDIDDIFNKAIEPLHTEPSDDFWRRAAENIIARGSEATEKKAARWRAVAFILGVGLLLLGYFTYKIENGLENVDKQIEAVKNVQDQNIAKWNKTNTVGNNTNAAVITTSNTGSTNKKSQHSMEKQVKSSSYSSTSQNKKVTAPGSRITSYKKQDIHYSAPVVAFNQSPQNITEHTQSADVIVNSADNKLLSTEQQLESSPSKEIAGSDKNLSKIPSEVVSVNLNKDSDDNKDIVSDTTIQTDNKTATAPFDPKLVQKANQSSMDSVSRLSVTAYFSPDFLMGYGFKSTNLSGTQSENAIKSQEKPNFSYTTGASAEYALSRNFSINAGIAYQLFSFNIKPSVIYNQKQSDGDVGYYLTTSSGIINCPYEGYSKTGDSLKINASSTRQYLEIPLEAKYFFMNTTKLRAYVAAGIEINFSLGENTTMNWQDYWNESGTDDITSTEGSRNMYFSYYWGAGLSYKVGKCLSLYAEPGIHEAITPIDDNIALITYPKLFSISGGIIYNLK